MSRFSCALPIVVLLSLAAGERADACSCLPPPVDEERLAQMDEVFEGTVLERRTEYGPDCGTGAVPEEIVHLVEVSRVWKGQVPRQVLVRTEVSSCGEDVSEGETRIFALATTETGARWISTCGPALPASVADVADAALGSPHEAVDTVEALPTCGEEPGSSGCGATNGSPASTLWGALVFLGAHLVWTSRRRARARPQRELPRRKLG